MPAPLLAAAPVVAGAGKLGALGALGAKLKGALGALFGAKKAAATTQLTIPGLMGKTAGAQKSGGIMRMAGDALFGGMNKGDIALRLAPDLAFGALAAVQTPGDLTDKLVAGTTQAVGGSLGGLATGRLATRLGASPGVSTLVDMGGSFGGDMLGMAVGDTLQRGKDKLLGGEGLTAWERLNKQQQDEFVAQIRAQTLGGIGGIVPGMQEQYLV